LRATKGNDIASLLGTASVPLSAKRFFGDKSDEVGGEIACDHEDHVIDDEPHDEFPSMLSAFRGKSQAEAARCSSADLSNPRSALACRTRRDRTSGATSILHYFPYTNLTVPSIS